MSLLLLSILAIFLGWVVNRLRKLGSREHGLPPGPPTLPVIGNLHLFPTSRAHLKFTEWAETYGDIYSVKIGPATTIVVSSPRMMKQCLELNSATTSDRPSIHIVKLVYRENHLALVGYGPEWRNRRRIAHLLLHKEASRVQIPLQRAEGSLLMYNLLQDSKSLYGNIRRYAASVAVSMIFGVHCTTYDHPIIETFFEVIGKFEHIFQPGGHPPLSVFPFLKYIPERWAPWKKVCKDVRAAHQEYVYDLVERCVDRIANDKRNGSYMEHLLDTEAQSGFDREATCYLGLSLLEGAADTTAVYLQALFLCLSDHPDVMAKAQADIDDVVGTDRTPELEDLEELPYIQAIIKEVHRYHPILPTAIPHAASADTMIGEYLIPKGSTIFMNIWAIGRDKNLFEKPDEFWPERFMNSQFGTKPGADTTGCREIPFSFGSGRRICPGTTFAGQSIAMTVMNFLWAFDMSHPKDPTTGMPVSLSADNITDATVLAPKPYTCDLKPRSQAKAALIKQKFEASRHILERFDI